MLPLARPIEAGTKGENVCLANSTQYCDHHQGTDHVKAYLAKSISSNFFPKFFQFYSNFFQFFSIIQLIVAQYCYVRFTNNEREHFILQINECLGAISFDKAFSLCL
jgi:hypothetical protein